MRQALRGPHAVHLFLTIIGCTILISTLHVRRPAAAHKWQHLNLNLSTLTQGIAFLKIFLIVESSTDISPSSLPPPSSLWYCFFFTLLQMSTPPYLQLAPATPPPAFTTLLPVSMGYINDSSHRNTGNCTCTVSRSDKVCKVLVTLQHLTVLCRKRALVGQGQGCDEVQRRGVGGRVGCLHQNEFPLGSSQGSALPGDGRSWPRHPSCQRGTRRGHKRGDDNVLKSSCGDDLTTLLEIIGLYT
uniref:Uncharacterized protein n=1 Tax=Myotis myotis TaxID=51298 RepID=A0A7J7UPD4_MYOMY|nr:hypothetical protein mMyoMyo1_008581 [Myotis myotis]